MIQPETVLQYSICNKCWWKKPLPIHKWNRKDKERKRPPPPPPFPSTKALQWPEDNEKPTGQKRPWLGTTQGWTPALKESAKSMHLNRPPVGWSEWGWKQTAAVRKLGHNLISSVTQHCVVLTKRIWKIKNNRMKKEHLCYGNRKKPKWGGGEGGWETVESKQHDVRFAKEYKLPDTAVWFSFSAHLRQIQTPLSCTLTLTAMGWGEKTEQQMDDTQTTPQRHQGLLNSGPIKQLKKTDLAAELDIKHIYVRNIKRMPGSGQKPVSCYSRKKWS